MEWLFEQLGRAALKLQRDVAFLGHRANAEELFTDPAKVEAIREWSTPPCVRDFRAFPSLCSYNRKFVPEFSEIAAPLHSLTRKNRRFLWDEVCQESFERLKMQLISSPVLALPEDDGDFIIDTDASEAAMGAVLSQIHEGEERPVVVL